MIGDLHHGFGVHGIVLHAAVFGDEIEARRFKCHWEQDILAHLFAGLLMIQWQRVVDLIEGHQSHQSTRIQDHWIHLPNGIVKIHPKKTITFDQIIIRFQFHIQIHCHGDKLVPPQPNAYHRMLPIPMRIIEDGRYHLFIKNTNHVIMGHPSKFDHDIPQFQWDAALLLLKINGIYN